MSRKQRPIEVKQGAPEWMNTYGDMVTLLLCFFVLLFSMASIDAAKFRIFVSAIQGGPGVLQGETHQYPLQNPMQQESVDDQFENLYQAMSQYVEEHDLTADVSVTRTESEILLRMQDDLLFDLGSAAIKPEARMLLDELSAQFELALQAITIIRIEGHTDNWPINTPQFPSNWELSTMRATNVLRFLSETKGLNPTKVVASGYGEYHPVAPNDNAENRTKNRRVDIVILKQDTQTIN